MKPLLVGDGPTRSNVSYTDWPLSGVFARTLCRAMELPDSPTGKISLDEWTRFLYSKFDCLYASKTLKWNRREAADRLAWNIQSDREVVVLFGRKVQEAYAAMTHPADSFIASLGFYRWEIDPLSPTGRRQVLVLPVPKIVQSLVQKDPASRILIGGLLNEAVEKASQLEETRL